MLDEWKFVVIDFLSTSDFSLFFLLRCFTRISPEDECLFCIYTIDVCWIFIPFFTLKQIHFLLSKFYTIRGYVEGKNKVKVVKVFMILELFLEVHRCGQ